MNLSKTSEDRFSGNASFLLLELCLAFILRFSRNRVIFSQIVQLLNLLTCYRLIKLPLWCNLDAILTPALQGGNTLPRSLRRGAFLFRPALFIDTMSKQKNALLTNTSYF